MSAFRPDASIIHFYALATRSYKFLSRTAEINLSMEFIHCLPIKIMMGPTLANKKLITFK